MIVGNRSLLWFARADFETARRDLVECIQLARSVGNARVELIPTHNLADMLYCLGYDDDAMRYAQRTREIIVRYLEGAMMVDDLLAARMAMVRRDRDAARRELAALDRYDPSDLPPGPRRLRDAVAAWLDDAPVQAWERIVAAGDGLQDDELCELWYLRAIALGTDEPITARLRELGARSPVWRARIGALG